MPELLVHLQDAKRTVSVKKTYQLGPNDTGHTLIDQVRNDVGPLLPPEETVLEVTLAGYCVVDVEVFSTQAPWMPARLGENIPFHLVGLSPYSDSTSSSTAVCGAVETSQNTSSLTAYVSEHSPLCPIAATQAYRRSKGQQPQPLQVWFSSKESGPATSINIVIKSFNGHMAQFSNVSPSTLVQEMISSATQRLGIPQQHTMLIHEGRSLQAGMKLSECGLNPTNLVSSGDVGSSAPITVTMYLMDMPQAGMFACSSGRKGYNSLLSFSSVTHAFGGLLGSSSGGESEHWQLALPSGKMVAVPFSCATTFGAWHSHILQLVEQDEVSNNDTISGRGANEDNRQLNEDEHLEKVTVE